MHKGNDIVKKGYFLYFIFIFSPFLFGIHCYCFCQLFFNFRIIEKQSIGNITKTESSDNIHNNKNKKFYFKGPNDLNEELLFSEEETVENLLFEYKKIYKSNVDIENLYFFFMKKELILKKKELLKLILIFQIFMKK